jgi:hypothetical protein
MNAFLDIAERQIPNPRKARICAAEKRNEKLREDYDLLQEWRRWRKEHVDALLTGPYGEPANTLLGFLNNMTIEQASHLIEFVKQGPWRGAGEDVRFEVLHLVGAAIVRVREHHKLPPFDDALPGDPPTAFEIVREWLR